MFDGMVLKDETTKGVEKGETKKKKINKSFCPFFFYQNNYHVHVYSNRRAVSITATPFCLSRLHLPRISVNRLFIRGSKPMPGNPRAFKLSPHLRSKTEIFSRTRVCGRIRLKRYAYIQTHTHTIYTAYEEEIYVSCANYTVSCTTHIGTADPLLPSHIRPRNQPLFLPPLKTERC